MATLSSAVGFCATVCGLALMVTPLREVLDLTSAKADLSIEKKRVSHVIYVAMLANYSLWTLFGWILPDPFVWVPNLVGTTLVTFYLYRLTSSNTFDSSQSVFATFIILLVISTLAYSFNQSLVESDGLGYLGALLSILMYGSPLSALKDVVDSKSTAQLSFPLSLVILFVTFLWSFYGFLVGNPFIMVPNVIGLALAAVQVMLFLIYPSKSNKPVIISV